MNNRRKNEEGLFDGEEYFLQPGHIFFSTEASVIRTVLGSCVSVCLWDKQLKYGGINHFIYPVIREKEKATPKYGNVATLALIKIMEDACSEPDNIVAQLFGGAKPDSANSSKIGEDNVLIAKKILKKKGIKIVSEDTGGTLGRKIIFDTSRGEVAVLKVHQIRESDWFHISEEA